MSISVCEKRIIFGLVKLHPLQQWPWFRCIHYNSVTFSVTVTMIPLHSLWKWPWFRYIHYDSDHDSVTFAMTVTMIPLHSLWQWLWFRYIHCDNQRPTCTKSEVCQRARIQQHPHRQCSGHTRAIARKAAGVVASAYEASNHIHQDGGSRQTCESPPVAARKQRRTYTRTLCYHDCLCYGWKLSLYCGDRIDRIDRGILCIPCVLCVGGLFSAIRSLRWRLFLPPEARNWQDSQRRPDSSKWHAVEQKN